jgi:hypothetical protein
VLLKLTIFVVVICIFAILSIILLIGESQEVDGSASFLTYNDAAYGISIQYPPNWQIDQSSHEFLISFLQNLSSSEAQPGLDQLNDEIKSKISELLDAFGLKDVSEVFGLNPDRKTEFLQLTSQAMNDGRGHILVAIRSPDREGNLNIVAENISAYSTIPLNDYVNASIGGLKILTPDLTMEQQPTELTVNGIPVLTFVYSAKNPFDKSLSAKFLVAAVIDRETGYILTFRSTPEFYSTYESTFNEMLQSFKITN